MATTMYKASVVTTLGLDPNYVHEGTDTPQVTTVLGAFMTYQEAIDAAQAFIAGVFAIKLALQARPQQAGHTNSWMDIVDAGGPRIEIIHA
jgi:hypothetical protein